VEIIGRRERRLLEKEIDNLHEMDYIFLGRCYVFTPPPAALLLRHLHYAIAAHRLGIVDQYKLPLQLRYDYITKTKEPQYLQFTFAPDHNEAKRIIARFKACCKGMREDIIYPNPGWMCSGCGYKAFCGKWPELPDTSDTSLRHIQREKVA
jgi:hypothetical protein